MISVSPLAFDGVRRRKRQRGRPRTNRRGGLVGRIRVGRYRPGQGQVSLKRGRQETLSDQAERQQMERIRRPRQGVPGNVRGVNENARPNDWSEGLARAYNGAQDYLSWAAGGALSGGRAPAIMPRGRLAIREEL